MLILQLFNLTWLLTQLHSYVDFELLMVLVSGQVVTLTCYLNNHLFNKQKKMDFRPAQAAQPPPEPSFFKPQSVKSCLYSVIYVTIRKQANHRDSLPEKEYF